MSKTKRVTSVLASVMMTLPAVAQTPIERAWATLTSAVEDNSVAKRTKAVLSLGLIPANAKATSMAEDALADEVEGVRAAAATALGQMRAGGSAPKLRMAVQDKAAAVAFAATNSLFLIGDPSAYEVYYAVLAGEKKSGDTLLESQLKTIQDPKALARVGFEQGIGFVPFGGASYTAFKMMTKDDISPLRAAAAAKLANDPDPKSQQLLESAISDKKWLVRAGAIDALAKRGNPNAIPAIAVALDDEDEVVRFTACAAVIRLSAATKSRHRPAGGK